jgi:hypothetical protein
MPNLRYRAQLGIEPEAIEGANDVTLFEDLGNGQTKLTFIGNEPMESAKKADKWRAGARYSISLPQFLRTWCRRNKKLKL